MESAINSLSELEYQKALRIFQKRQEYNKNYYSRKKAEKATLDMGRKPKNVEEIDEQQASHILQQYKNKTIKRKKLSNDVDALKETIQKLQDKLNLLAQHNAVEDDETF